MGAAYTFYATDARASAALAPLRRAADARGIATIAASSAEVPARLGIYCVSAGDDHPDAVPSINADLAVVMPADLHYGRPAWPQPWLQHPWDAYDVGLLPGSAWHAMYAADVARLRPRVPRWGLHVTGWPRADAYVSADAPPPRRRRPWILLVQRRDSSVDANDACWAFADAGADVFVCTGRPGAIPAFATHVVPAHLERLLPQVDLVVSDGGGVLAEAGVLGIPALDLQFGAEPHPSCVDDRFLSAPAQSVTRAELAAAAVAALARGRAAVDPALWSAWFGRPGGACDAALDLIAQYAPQDSFVSLATRARRGAGGRLAATVRGAAGTGPTSLEAQFLIASRPATELLGLRFDENFYIEQYPDIRQAVARGERASGFAHWCEVGRAEGRKFRVIDMLALPQPVVPAAALPASPEGGVSSIEAAALTAIAPSAGAGGQNVRAAALEADGARMASRLGDAFRSRRPIVIWTTRCRPTSGGNMVLHRLCHMLRQRGEDASIWLSDCAGAPGDLYPGLDTPVANGRVDAAEAVVVYPEVVDGNPLQGRHVLRWLLNAPGVVDGRGLYGPEDLFAHYSPHFAPDADPAHELCILVPPPPLPPAPPVVRDGGCFVIRKGRNKTRLAATAGMRELHDPDHAECQAAFSVHKVFYSYDSATYLSLQAALYGCLSVVIPDVGVNAAAWRRGHPVFRYGVAYGEGEMDWAERTRHLVPDHLASIVHQGEAQVDALLARLAPLR